MSAFENASRVKTRFLRPAASIFFKSSLRVTYSSGENSTLLTETLRRESITPSATVNTRVYSQPDPIFSSAGTSFASPSAPSSTVMTIFSSMDAVLSMSSGNRLFAREVFPPSKKLAMPRREEMYGTVRESCETPRRTTSGSLDTRWTRMGDSVSRMSFGSMSHFTSSAPGTSDLTTRSNVFTRSSGFRFTSTLR